MLVFVCRVVPSQFGDRKGEPSLRAKPFGPCWGHSDQKLKRAIKMKQFKNSEKAQGLSRRTIGKSLGRSVPQKLGSRAAAVEMIMFTVQTFPQPKYRACLEPLARIAREISEYEKLRCCLEQQWKHGKS